MNMDQTACSLGLRSHIGDMTMGNGEWGKDTALSLSTSRYSTLRELSDKGQHEPQSFHDRKGL